MAISSWTDVVNAALIKLGSTTITNVANPGNHKAGRLAAVRYEACRDIVLRLHPWNCATERVNTSNLDDVEPEFEYEYYHNQPSDCLRVLKVGPEGVDYRVQGRYIATDETLLELTYIKRVEDVTQIDHLCLEAIATYIAWDISIALEGNAEIRNVLWDQFKQIIAQAKSVDAKEDPASELEADTWIDSRYGAFGSHDRSNNWMY
jgi:hypothetical protein